MATSSTSLGLTLPATGDYSGSWGATANTNSLILESVVSGITTITSSGGLSLPSLNSGTIGTSNYAVLKLAPSIPNTSITVQLPTVNRVYTVYNTSTSNSQTLQYGTSGGTVSVPAGATATVITDSAANTIYFGSSALLNGTNTLTYSSGNWTTPQGFSCAGVTSQGIVAAQLPASLTNGTWAFHGSSTGITNDSGLLSLIHI